MIVELVTKTCRPLAMRTSDTFEDGGSLRSVDAALASRTQTQRGQPSLNALPSFFTNALTEVRTNLTSRGKTLKNANQCRLSPIRSVWFAENVHPFIGNRGNSRVANLQPQMYRGSSRQNDPQKSYELITRPIGTAPVLSCHTMVIT